jgi:transcription-repair coupling factor (superfamily II helicase)
VKPKLSRVRGEAWTKAKRKVEENTLHLAQDVLALYATREMLQRPPFDPAVEPAVKKFEETFRYKPTPDQIKCFEDVENDMVWRSRPMDRLVCGDVGFGKTEIAFRALYRAVANGRQAALLAPTGVLAAQHYKNVVERLGANSPFNITVTLLRGGMGKTTKTGRDVRDRINNGEIELVVGTHALLSNEIRFKDLGLLVVDEEQRFGVKQKERLKLITNGIDVLTLTATPIPRTLQMSLSGIRDTSTLRSAPPMRKPTITFVQQFSEATVQEAIGRELARGGQCYYVVPRIAMLQEAEELIGRLFPDAAVIQAHGRLRRNGAEENVAKFATGEYDILLATTVIENGVDIPTVNTIIVQNSQAFGMSTLYQLRGRVGRSDKQGYSYFLHREESVTEQAAMRLQAIGELNELGSGFDVANRDLEIRGAGSLLGTEQSGLAAKVGFDLYMRMLKKSIRKLRGLDLPLVPRTNILLTTECTPDSFTIPPEFIADAQARKREESKTRLSESTTALVSLTNSWKECYGELPRSLQTQLKTMHLHACSRRLGIDLIGLVNAGDTDRLDCVLRSPGLRPRHWALIVSMLSKGAPPKGLDVIFPARFTASGEEEQVEGGKRLDLKSLLVDETLNEDQEEEEWDAMDQEEVEAMKEISSAVNVKHLDEVDLEQYPRFVVTNFGSDNQAPVDRLLKLLLPVAKAAYDKQESQVVDAKAAADLREKQELLRTRRRVNESAEAQRMGYR